MFDKIGFPIIMIVKSVFSFAFLVAVITYFLCQLRFVLRYLNRMEDVKSIKGLKKNRNDCCRYIENLSLSHGRENNSLKLDYINSFRGSGNKFQEKKEKLVSKYERRNRVERGKYNKWYRRSLNVLTLKRIFGR